MFCQLLKEMKMIRKTRVCFFRSPLYLTEDLSDLSGSEGVDSHEPPEVYIPCVAPEALHILDRMRKTYRNIL